MPRLATALLLALVVVFGGGCPSKDGSDNGTILEDASFGRRVFRPPPSDPVRAVPPHNIHRTGVGPYELSASLQKTLALLPSGPRVELFEADGLFDYRLMRSDGDALLLGVGRRGGVAFISVLDPDIARTESGIGVGAGVQELIGALGALRAPENQGRDSRIITFTALPDTRFIVEKGKVVAAVVMPSLEGEPAATETEVPPSETAVSSKPTCKAESLEERRPEFLTLAKEARFAKSSQGPVVMHFVCLTGDRGGALLRRGDAIAWAVADPQSGDLRVQASGVVSGLSFVTTLDTGAPRPEIYAVSERRSSQLREVLVTRISLVGNRLVPGWTRVAFSLGAKTASWIGAQLQTADFLVEMSGRDGAVAVGGIYLERIGGALRHVVPVNRIELPVARDSRKASSEGPIRDGGAEPAPPKDAGPSARKP